MSARIVLARCPECQELLDITDSWNGLPPICKGHYWGHGYIKMEVSTWERVDQLKEPSMEDYPELAPLCDCCGYCQREPTGDIVNCLTCGKDCSCMGCVVDRRFYEETP